MGHGENSVFNIEQEQNWFWKYQKEGVNQGHIPVCYPLPIFDFRRDEYALSNSDPTSFSTLRPINMCPDGIKFPGSNHHNVLGTKNLLIWHCDTSWTLWWFRQAKLIQPVLWELVREPQKCWCFEPLKEREALVVVRFGNVLAVEQRCTNLQRQIAAGPVTVTSSGYLSLFHDDSRSSSTGFASLRHRSRWWSIHAQYGGCENCWLGKI